MLLRRFGRVRLIKEPLQLQVHLRHRSLEVGTRALLHSSGVIERFWEPNRKGPYHDPGLHKEMREEERRVILNLKYIITLKIIQLF